MTLVTNRNAFWLAGRRLVRAGSILDDQHPIVLRHPHLFAAVQVTEVEQATRAPGELSTARRPAPVEADDGLEGDPPAPSASKAEWVEWATGEGIDVTGMTKADIVELAGGDDG